jgi:hypothetical protein
MHLWIGWDDGRIYIDRHIYKKGKADSILNIGKRPVDGSR